jgi:taurine dioxygenase
MLVNELHPHFGLEIRNIDVAEASDTLIEELQRFLIRYGLLVIRRQLLEDGQLAEFSRRIGNGKLEESARRVSHSSQCSLISNLTNLQTSDKQPLGFAGRDTDYWHSDQEFRKSPATIASLYCLIPSPVGGRTGFAGTSFETLGLEPSFLPELRRLRSTRIPAASHDNVEHIEISHPVILKNPSDGRESVYVSENTLRFCGMEEQEGQRLKQHILAHMLAESNIYRHSWQMGDLLVYDNTQLLHRREAFEGPRWLKATKIFAPVGQFAVPQGETFEG